jgi:hypothetical protein
MKAFKLIDFWVSVLLIMGFTVPSLIKMDTTFLAGYITVGAWQIISMLIHAFTHTNTRKRGIRNIYHWIALIAIATMPIGSIFILLFTAAPMAIFYTWICGKEVFSNKDEHYERI